MHMSTWARWHVNMALGDCVGLLERPCLQQAAVVRVDGCHSCGCVAWPRLIRVAYAAAPAQRAALQRARMRMPERQGLVLEEGRCNPHT